MTTRRQYGVSYDCKASPECEIAERHQRDGVRVVMNEAVMRNLVAHGQHAWNPPGRGQGFVHAMKGHVRTIEISDWGDAEA